jgi:hypothetical protein
VFFVSFAFFSCPVAVSNGTNLLVGVNQHLSSAKRKAILVCVSVVELQLCGKDRKALVGGGGSRL